MLACVGNWIKLLHDDELLAEGALKRFTEVASEHPAVVYDEQLVDSMAALLAMR